MWRRNETEPLSIAVTPQSPVSTGIRTALAKTPLCLIGSVGEMNESTQKNKTKTKN